MATPAPRPITKAEPDGKSTVRSKRKAENVIVRPRYPALRPKPEPAAPALAATTVKVQNPPTRRLPHLPKRTVPHQTRSSGCPISLCRIKNCSLQTHHKWNFKKAASQKNSTAINPSIADGGGRTLNLLDAGLGTLTSLPIDIVDGVEARRLLRQFFTYDYPRQKALLHPPSLHTAGGAIDMRLQDAVRKSLSSSVVCIHHIASAHLHELTRQDDLSPKKISSRLRIKLLQLLREELNSFNADNAEDIMLIILTVVQFDVALAQYVVLDSHRNALQHLVNKLGGIHRLRYAHQYVINLDRMLAMFTGKPPLYAEEIDRGLLRSPWLPLRYGAALESLRGQPQYDSKVLDFCFDVCRAVEIVEHQNWTFEPGREQNSFDPSQIQYLYFLKYTIFNAFAHLQPDSSPYSAKFKSVLFAANIVAYVILQINFLPTVTLLLLRRLRSALKEQQLREDWLGEENTLCWILCVLVMAPASWDGKVWARACLIELLCNRYGYGGWPNGWIEEALADVRCYVWSSRLDGHLSKALVELESSRFLSVGNMRIDT